MPQYRVEVKVYETTAVRREVFVDAADEWAAQELAEDLWAAGAYNRFHAKNADHPVQGECWPEQVSLVKEEGGSG